MESILCIRHLHEKYRKPDSTVESVDSARYFDCLNDIMAAYAHFGRIRDMARDIGQKLRLENWSNPFEGIYSERHIIVHGKKAPFALIAGAVAIPTSLAEGESKSVWHDGKHWGDLAVDSLTLFSDALGEKLEILLVLFDRFLGQVYGKMKEIYGEMRVRFPENPPPFGEAGSAGLTFPNPLRDERLNSFALVSGQYFIPVRQEQGE